MFLNVEPEAISSAAMTLESLTLKLQGMVAACQPTLQFIPPAGSEEISVFAAGQHMFNSENFLMMAQQSIAELQRLIITLHANAVEYAGQDLGNAATFGGGIL